MKADPDKLHALLDDVLPSCAEDCGPSGDDVRDMVRRHRQYRRRRSSVIGIGAGVLSILAIAIGPQLWRHEPAIVASVTHAPPKTAPIAIEHVNDEQLFALLQDTPAALMEWPDGKRTLLVIATPPPP